MTPSVAKSPALALAVDWLASGKIVAYPTETVWGLAVDSCSEAALQALRRWKGRREEQPISILVPDVASLEALGFELSLAASALAQKFWPGPLTLVLPCRAALARRFARGIARDDGAVGVRCSSHPEARALARAALNAGLGPITTTSLNRSGNPSLQTLAEVRELCAREPDGAELFVLAPDASCDAECSEALRTGGAPSTVLDLAAPNLEILRSGAIAWDAIVQTLDEARKTKKAEEEK